MAAESVKVSSDYSASHIWKTKDAVTVVIIHMKKLLDSDWLRAVQKV